MGLDLRWPIGLMFSIVGALLFFKGLTSSAEEIQKAVNTNINLWWGLVLLAFGLTMSFFSWRAKAREADVRRAE